MTPETASSSNGWCGVCGTRHEESIPCPGELRATGPERHGWRVCVETGSGARTIGVLVAPCAHLWRGRILTFPNILWTIPGGRGSMKYVGLTAREAERKAAKFVERHCSERGWRRRGETATVEAGSLTPETGDCAEDDATGRRKLRTLPIRFGSVEPDCVGMTVDLSAEGMFIGTELQLEPAEPLTIQLDVQGQRIDIRGIVVWSRPRHESGRPAGMGVRLFDPPLPYARFVRALP